MKTFKQYITEDIIDKSIIASAIHKVLPHVRILQINRIGSSILSPEELKQHGIDKYGIEDYEIDDADIDIEVITSEISSSDREEWAFSREAQELEDKYNWDVQIK